MIEKNKTEEILNDIISDSIFSGNISEIRRLLLSTSHLFFNTIRADSGTLWLKHDGKLTCIMVFSNSLPYLNTTIDQSAGLAGAICTNRQSLLVNDINTDERAIFQDITRKTGYINYLGCPITVHGEIIGVLSYYRKKSSDFTQSDLTLMECFCKFLSLSIINCTAAEKITDEWIECFRLFANIDFPSAKGRKQAQSDKFFYSWTFNDDLPKNIHPITLKYIKKYLDSCHDYADSNAIATALELSASTARRYLNYLFSKNLIEKKIVYTTTGHPTYQWRLK